MRLHHVQVACPAGAEDDARRFYRDGLGLTEVDKPAARVEFFIDDIPAATLNAPPFKTRLDLGSVPRLRTIKAVARDVMNLGLRPTMDQLDLTTVLDTNRLWLPEALPR